jgi:uncharacterized NAD-dependent epimerase/dehydratase family protein
MQHAPARKEYDGFPGYPLHPLETQIQAVELIADRPVIAITINHEHLDGDQLERAIQEIHDQTGLPVFDPLRDGADSLVEAVRRLAQTPSA